MRVYSRRMRESWELCCPERATFPIPFSQCTHSTYVYRSFVSDLVPAKFVAVNKNVRGKLIVSEQASTSHILCGHHYEPSPHYVYVLTESTISGLLRSNDPRPPDFSPRLRDKIWEWPGTRLGWGQGSIGRLELLLMLFLAKNTCNVLVEEDFDSWYTSRL